MERASQHTFQLLTKRAERFAAWTQERYSQKGEAGKTPWPKNVWAGVSVENESYVSRISELQRVPADVRFLSVEPLLRPESDSSLNI